MLQGYIGYGLNLCFLCISLGSMTQWLSVFIKLNPIAVLAIHLKKFCEYIYKMEKHFKGS